jgi:hypothetical protein
VLQTFKIEPGDPAYLTSFTFYLGYTLAYGVTQWDGAGFDPVGRFNFQTAPLLYEAAGRQGAAVRV